MQTVTPGVTQKKERAVIFIDGNNFYHSMKAIKCSSKKLNYETFSRKLVENYREWENPREWIATRYYTAQVRVDSKASNQQEQQERYKKQRQFLTRLERFNRVKCFLGRLEKHPARLPKELRGLLNNLPKNLDTEISEQLRQFKNIQVWVERAVDEQIAVDMVAMAYRGEYDVAYLLSADGDFTPAVKEVLKTDGKKKVFIASPSEGHQLARAVGDSCYIRTRIDFFDGCWL